jgi:mycofactocin glycosyltransferase
LKKAVSVSSLELPSTTKIDMDPGLQVLAGVGGNTVLLGGSPYKLVSLRPGAAAVVESLRGGGSLETAAHAANVTLAATEKLARRLLSNGMAEPRHQAPHIFCLGDITAVIPARNEAVTIGGIVTALFGHGLRTVVVVDDASSDDTAAAAREAGATVVKRESAGGPGAARMSGLLTVDTPLVLFVDADTELHGTWLPELIEAFDDPLVGIAAPRVMSSSSSHLIGRYEHIRSALDLGARRASVRPLSRVSYIPSAAWLAKVATLQQVGGFDPSLRYGEDVDLVWRAVAAGFVVRYEGHISVQHRPRGTLRELMKQRHQYGTSAAPLDIRHPGAVAPLVASGWSVLSWAMALLGGPIGVTVGLTAAVSTSLALEKKMSMVQSSRKIAFSTAMRGHLGLGRQLASCMWRTWLPLAGLAALFSQRIRWVLVVAGIGPAIEQWVKQRPPLDPVRFAALRMLDDASYCSGVWKGCWQVRHFGPLKPRLVNWPGRPEPTQQDNTVPNTTESAVN